MPILAFRSVAAPGAVVALLAFAPPAAAATLCRVADPTGTRLNLRTAPNMTVLGTVANGVRVAVVETVRGPDGKSWSYLTDPRDGVSLGWAFTAYLDCR